MLINLCFSLVNVSLSWQSELRTQKGRGKITFPPLQHQPETLIQEETY